MSNIQVLAIGELLADVISVDYADSLSEARTFELHAGGSPSNVCANLNWLGIKTALVSCVGQDSIGDFLLEGIRRIGLETSYIHRSKTFPTSIVLVSRSRSTPDFIAYRSADTQLPEVNPGLIHQSKIIHTCAFALSKNPAQHHILDALSLGSSLNKTISVDWNYAPSMWESDGQLVFQKVVSMHPLLKISIDDISRFAGKDLSAEESRNFLQKLPVKLVCLTCGKDGVWYKSMLETDWHFEKAIAVQEVKDTTGAGDAFWSGFIAAYLQDKTISNCVLEGVNIASRKIQKFGPLYQS